MQREIFNADHEAFRDTVKRFIAAEIAPYHAQWERDGVVPRELWRKAGEAALLGSAIPEAYGGAGADSLYNFVLVEEMARAGMTGPAFSLHCEIVMPYILKFGSESQKDEWLPKRVRGEAIGALGMTEPGAGSDVRNLRARVATGTNLSLTARRCSYQTASCAIS